MQINNTEICVKVSDSTINFNGAIYPCQIGIEGGVHYAKGAEGDKKTPKGTEFCLDTFSAKLSACVNNNKE